jgi:serine/threonine protein kinase
MGKKAIINIVKKIKSNKDINIKSSFKSYNEIGSGQYGKVYKACLNDKCANKIAVKNSTDNMSAEFAISTKLAKMGVPQVYGYEKRSNRDLLFSEFLTGVTLRSYLEKWPKADEMKSIIIQVVYILWAIHQEFPTFRHHDLHLDNIMVLKKRTSTDKVLTTGNTTVEFNDAKIEIKLMDFGLSTEKSIVNPAVKKSTTFKSQYGIFPGSDKGYDLHLFLISLYNAQGAVTSARFIESLFIKSLFIKSGYLKRSSDVTSEFRLRSDVKHDLPSFEEVLSHPYFSRPRNTVKKFVNKLPAPSKAIPMQTNKAKTPVNKENAKQKAMIMLMKIANAKKEPKKAVVVKRPTLTKSPAKPLSFRSSAK